jgi:hypothetical protein
MKKSIYILASLFLVLSSSPIFAQVDPGADPDAPVATIDNYVWVLALIGLVFVFLKVRSVMLQANTSK